MANSLYYLHLNTENDARLLAEEQDYVMSEEPIAEANSVVQKPLPRKPLPESARSSLDPNRRGQANQRRPEQVAPDLPASSNVREFPVKEMTSQVPPARPPNQVPGAVLRRPLGPRPQLPESAVGKTPLPGTEMQPFNSRSQFRDIVSPKVSSDSCRSDHSKYDRFKTEGFTKSFSITVIRRDPSSGAQWNVGTIVGEGHNRGMKAMSYSNISVHLTTPGYTTFRNSQTTYSTEIPPQSQHQQVAVDGSVSTVPNWGFDRQVRMEGSSFWELNSKQHKRSRSYISDTRDATRGSSESSATDVPDVLSGVHSAADPLESGSKGYVFLSPWGGRCKFSTGGGGRSLRCKHTLPGLSSANSALVESSTSAPVSELRFNLPRSAVFNASTASNNTKGRGIDSGRFSVPKLDHIRNKLSHNTRPPLPPRPLPTSYAAMYASDNQEQPPLPPRSHADQYMTDSSDEQEAPPLPNKPRPFSYTPRSSSEEEERLHLSIGREKAGGGRRGKRAKLGKLIIHDEGFKMLDLVIAANMGVWWTVWESNH